MTRGWRTAFWVGLLVLAIAVVWRLSGILLPFVSAMAIAYLVDPIVVRLERRGFSRGGAAALLVGVSFLAGVASLVILLPIAIEQTIQLWARLPAIVEALRAATTPLASRLLGVMGVAPGAELPAPLAEGIRRVGIEGADVALGMLTQGIALVNLAALMSVTPLVTWYLLRDWPKVVREVDGWLPRRHAATIRAQAAEIDRVLAGFVRGAAVVCAVQSLFYAIALSLAGLEFGFVIGLGAGVLSFVPYLGASVGLVVSVGTALVQFWPRWPRMLVVAAIFVGGNLVADYVLTPRLVGGRVRLHPVWVLFGMFAGGALLGFVGLLISVPASAAVGVLARFAIERYKRSPLYEA